MLRSAAGTKINWLPKNNLKLFYLSNVYVVFKDFVKIILHKMDPHPESEVLCEGWMVKSPPLDAKPTPYSLYKPVRNFFLNSSQNF